jgi:hypothetical protein
MTYDRESIRSWAEDAGELDYLLEEQKRDNDPEYRQDDENVGYCPECGEPLSAMMFDAKGLCEIHGWVYANWKSQS